MSSYVGPLSNPSNCIAKARRGSSTALTPQASAMRTTRSQIRRAGVVISTIVAVNYRVGVAFSTRTGAYSTPFTVG